MTADTSVLVPAFATWHEGHEVCRRAIGEGIRLVAHAALETYSVLTRLPPPHRVSPAAAHAFLDETSTGEWLVLDGSAQSDLLTRLSAESLTGGAVHDALIALTAATAGGTLLTRDGRASRVYQLLGVAFVEVR